jgi:hypothetical protein
MSYVAIYPFFFLIFFYYKRRTNVTSKWSNYTFTRIMTQDRLCPGFFSGWPRLPFYSYKKKKIRRGYRYALRHYLLSNPLPHVVALRVVVPHGTHLRKVDCMFPVFFAISSVLELPTSLPVIRLDPIGEDESRQHLFREEQTLPTRSPNWNVIKS